MKSSFNLEDGESKEEDGKMVARECLRRNEEEEEEEERRGGGRGEDKGDRRTLPPPLLLLLPPCLVPLVLWVMLMPVLST
jgi:hypothetical protein